MIFPVGRMSYIAPLSSSLNPVNHCSILKRLVNRLEAAGLQKVSHSNRACCGMGICLRGICDIPVVGRVDSDSVFHGGPQSPGCFPNELERWDVGPPDDATWVCQCCRGAQRKKLHLADRLAATQALRSMDDAVNSEHRAWQTHGKTRIRVNRGV